MKNISIGLRARLYLILGALAFLLISSGGVTLWYVNRTQAIFSEVLERDMALLHTAYELEISLLNQKGFTTYFMLSGDASWLEELETNRSAFEKALTGAKQLESRAAGREILERIDTEFVEYNAKRTEVTVMYSDGRISEGETAHWGVRERFFAVLNSCREYRLMIEEKMTAARVTARNRSHRVAALAITGMSGSALLFVLLIFILMSQVLEPIRRIAGRAALLESPGRTGNEVATLGREVDGLLERIGHTSDELERSRELLLLSEKMAVVGKLAAEVAHSIRNPMTSIKMRLFSLQRGLELNQAQKEDLSVISDEMWRLDNIVRSFLEFSRPPQLRTLKINAPDIVGATLTLLEKRLEHDDIRAEVSRREPLPQIEADPELMKEVLVNLVVNACEAMEHGGNIFIAMESDADEELGRVVRIAVSDDGPGIPARILERVTEPFYTTKEEGTGLGLSIAARVINEHGGRLEVLSVEGEGATFIISLPVTEDAE